MSTRKQAPGDVVIHSHPASLLREVSTDDFTLLSLKLPVCVVGTGMREKGSVKTRALFIPNLESGDSGPSHSKVALFPHFRGKFTSGSESGRGSGGECGSSTSWYKARKS